MESRGVSSPVGSRHPVGAGTRPPPPRGLYTWSPSIHIARCKSDPGTEETGLNTRPRRPTFLRRREEAQKEHSAEISRLVSALEADGTSRIPQRDAWHLPKTVKKRPRSASLVVNISSESSPAVSCTSDEDSDSSSDVNRDYEEGAVCDICKQTLTKDEALKAREAGLANGTSSSEISIRSQSKIPPINSRRHGATYVERLSSRGGVGARFGSLAGAKSSLTLLNVYLPRLEYEDDHRSTCSHVIKH